MFESCHGTTASVHLIGLAIGWLVNLHASDHPLQQHIPPVRYIRTGGYIIYNVYITVCVSVLVCASSPLLTQMRDVHRYLEAKEEAKTEVEMEVKTEVTEVKSEVDELEGLPQSSFCLECGAMACGCEILQWTDSD